jgi:NTP pyrophosphatase (non-canonical NTP hydrolase)
MNEPGLSQLMGRISRFNEERNWTQFHDPKNLALSLQLEASEVLELFQWTKDNQAKAGKEQEMADELADVFYWTILLANHYKIDLIGALEKKMDQNETKYPITKAKGKAVKYTDL